MQGSLLHHYLIAAGGAPRHVVAIGILKPRLALRHSAEEGECRAQVVERPVPRGSCLKVFAGIVGRKVGRAVGVNVQGVYLARAQTAGNQACGSAWGRSLYLCGTRSQGGCGREYVPHDVRDCGGQSEVYSALGRDVTMLHACHGNG